MANPNSPAKSEIPKKPADPTPSLAFFTGLVMLFAGLAGFDLRWALCGVGGLVVALIVADYFTLPRPPAEPRS